MTRIIYRSLKIILLMLVPLPSYAETTGNVRITVTNMKHDLGFVVLQLHNSPDTFPGHSSGALRKEKKKIINKKAIIVLDNIYYGNYAIAVYHDENSNGKLDTNFIGIPSEGVGASNNAKGRFGPPKYSDAKFNVEQPMIEQNISMNYSLF